MPSLPPGLTAKQKLFIYYYLESPIGTRAAKLAGYAGNDRTLTSVATENLRKPLIRDALEEVYRSRMMSSSHVLAELSDIATAPWRDFVEVKTNDQGDTVHAQLRLADKIRALELTGKYFKLFTERTETETTLTPQSAAMVAQVLAETLLDMRALIALEAGQGDGMPVRIGTCPNSNESIE